MEYECDIREADCTRKMCRLEYYGSPQCAITDRTKSPPEIVFYELSTTMSARFCSRRELVL